jgi:cyclopropane fatty-acyl-phospholipid synthase-like methyltransferase
MSDRRHGNDVAAGQFYDSLWSSGLSSAALVHGSAYIGQECLLTPDEILAFGRRAGITTETQVLDIGSGRGGPACYLAQQLGCRVVGIDPSTVGHSQAVTRAHDAGVGHLVQFRWGDIHGVVLPRAAFDIVLGLEAWCHIPRRAELLQHCTTLLRSGGRVAFYDHVERRSMSDVQRQRFCALWRFAGLETPASYLDAVRAAGLQVLYHEETSAYAVRFYSRLVEAYQEHRTEFEAARGSDRYREGLERLQMSQELAAAGTLGQLACIAASPGRA